jgi:hypothetical protein
VSKKQPFVSAYRVYFARSRSRTATVIERHRTRPLSRLAEPARAPFVVPRAAQSPADASRIVAILPRSTTCRSACSMRRCVVRSSRSKPVVRVTGRVVVSVRASLLGLRGRVLQSLCTDCVETGPLISSILFAPRGRRPPFGLAPAPTTCDTDRDATT